MTNTIEHASMIRTSVILALLVSIGMAGDSLSRPARPRARSTAFTAASATRLYWGVSLAGVADDIAPLTWWETNVAGKAVSIVHWGHFWGLGDAYQPWSRVRVDNARAHGAIPMISWTPEGGDPSRWQLSRIIDGSHDAYIRQFATDAKGWGHPFFLRMMHEMNGAWGYPWQEDENGNRRGEFVQAWRHIVDIFRQVGVANATFVWCPNVDQPKSQNPTYAALYPGDDYVDWTCLDGYNWGARRASGWQTFDQVYGYSYNEVLKLAPEKPMLIGELGCAEDGAPAGASKAAWLAGALALEIPRDYKQIRGVVYYNRVADGVDWRIESSPAAQAAWQSAIAAPTYLGNDFGDYETSPIAAP